MEPYNEIEVKRHISRVRELLSFSTESHVNGTLSYPTISAGESAFLEIENLNVDANHQATIAKSDPITSETFHKIYPTNELAPKEIPERKTAVHYLHYSQWNPPPPHLKTKGHILYLSVTTLEAKIYQIVAHSSGFYVSNSTAHWFDPTPMVIDGEIYHEHSLFTLLSKLSPLVSKTLEENKVKFANIPSQVYLPPTNSFLFNPWLVNEPTPKADLARTQNDFTHNIDLSSREWNEEFQSAREIETETVQSRMLRERLMNKVSFEFSQAAVLGALRILDGDVQSLNPFEEEESRIYLNEGIFYSLATDPSNSYEGEGGEEAARYAVGKDLLNVNFLNKIDINGITTVLTTVIDYAGHRILAQSPVPGIFRQLPEDESQIRYGSIDNLTTIGTDESFIEPLSNVAEAFHLAKHVYFDNSNKPAELVTPYSVTGVVGTDNRKYVLDLHRLTPLDLGFLESVSKDTETPYPHSVPVLRSEAVEFWIRTKAEVLAKEKLAEKKAKIDAEKAKEEETKPKEETKKEETKKEEKEEDSKNKGENEDEKNEETPAPEPLFLTAEERLEITKEINKKYTINPDVPFDITKIPAGPEREKYEKDAIDVRAISKNITESLIPKLLEELKNSATSAPFDGVQLTAKLHKRGINMRYLGHIANLIAKEETSLKPFHKLVVLEAVSRGAKHVINSHLKSYTKEVIPYVLAQLFNCLLGFKLNGSPEPSITKGLKALYGEEDFSKINEITVKSIRDEISREVKSRFRYDLPENWFDTISLRILFRELSLKIGIQWKARDYNFEATKPYYEVTPVVDAPLGIHVESASINNEKKSGGKKKRGKKGTNESLSVLQSPTPYILPTLFYHGDVLNIVPIIKSSTYQSQLAEDALEAGRIALLNDDKKNGLLLLSEAIGLYEQIYGPIHIEVARAYVQLSILYQEIKEIETACQLARKAVIISERCCGIDSAETIIIYLNLALFEHANNNVAGALSLIKHALKYWTAITETDHTDSLTTMKNVTTMFQSLNLRPQAINILIGATELSEKIYGENSAAAGTFHYQLSHLYLDPSSPDFESSLGEMKKAHKIFEDVYGAESPAAKECQKYIEHIEMALKSMDARKGITTNGSGAAGAAAGAIGGAATNGAATGVDSKAKQAAEAALRASLNRRANQHHHNHGHHNHSHGQQINGSTGNNTTSAAATAVSNSIGAEMSIDDLVNYINGEEGSSKKTNSSGSSSSNGSGSSNNKKKNNNNNAKGSSTSSSSSSSSGSSKKAKK